MQRFVVSQQWIDKKLMIRFLQDQEEIGTPKENLQGQIFENVKVYCSDPWYDTIFGYIEIIQLKITDKAPPSGKLFPQNYEYRQMS